MDDYKYKSHSRYVVQNIRKQPGIKGTETIDEILGILSDDEIARQIDKLANSADYNGPGHMRFTFEGAQLIARRCTPKADKIFTTFIAFANQGLRITISQSDLAELTLMSKPTVTAALKELENIYAIIIIPGDSRSGEADTYYINPAICACSKMSKQTAQEAVFWNLLKEEDATDHSQYEKAREARLEFKQLIKDAMSEFEKTFSRIENRDSSTREPLGVTIEKKGKFRTQEQVGRRRRKKGVSAGHTDTEQDTTSPTSHIDYNREEEDNSTPFTDNMQKNSGLLTESKEKIFSETLSRANFENDPEIPFN
jgi:DNA-binding transcriptional regulator GbsR (MarR family)